MRSLLFRLLDEKYAPPPDRDQAGWLADWAYAHRGLHGAAQGANAPENSLAAFRAAMAAGLGLECDVRRSKDGRAIVFHDEELDRLTAQSGPLRRRSVRELTAMRLQGSAETIPTLRDLLAEVAGKVPLLIEIKTRAARPATPICRAVRAELEGYAGPVAIMGFDPRVPRWFSAHAPQVLRGLVVSEENARTLTGRWQQAMSVWQGRGQFLACDIRDLPSRFAARHQARGLPLASWTVRTAEQLALARDCGAAPIAEAAAMALLAGEDARDPAA